MNCDVGPQYARDRQDDPSGFLEAARKHQSRFRADQLGVPFQKYGNFLTPDDAEKGKNFYSGLGVLEAARTRYPEVSKKVYANMLRSEHIPLNLFQPLNTDDAYRLMCFGSVIGVSMQSIRQVKIE